jgi:ribose transport system substrate-binding protein
VSPGAAGPRILFITNSNADWWDAVEKGAADAAAESGAWAEMRRNNEGTAQGQIRLLEDALGRPEIDAVAVSVVDAESPGIADAMKALRDSGKQVITYDSDIASEHADARRAYIGTNNRAAGVDLGRATATLRPEGGTVCVFVGNSAAANARDRRDGFLEGAGPKFRAVETFDDLNDKDRARSNVATALSKYPDVGVLLGLWSYNAPRIAVEAAADPARRQKIAVVAFDLDELAVGHLERGEIDVAAVQDPYAMGRLSVELLTALEKGDEAGVKAVLPDGPIRETGVRLVVPDGETPIRGPQVIPIAEMKRWLQSKGLRCS